MMSTAATAVYLLCLATSAVCAWLLVRGYLRHRTRLLLWSAACFVLLAFNNLFVVADMFLFPASDLTPFRTLSSLAAVSMLLYGFIAELD
jgi:hypothetical protein